MSGKSGKNTPPKDKRPKGEKKAKPQMVQALDPSITQTLIGLIDASPFKGIDAENVLRLKAALYKVTAKPV